MSALGRYTLLQRVGAGGMAEIWKARTSGAAGFEKTVAIKRILPEYCGDAQFVEMFIAEARLVQRLESANIVQVIDFGSEANAYYLVMEYVAGQNLAAVLARLAERKIEFPLSVILYVGIEAARGLGAAHRETDDIGRSLDIVHRDISPHNILLSWQGEVKVVDFGIAKAASLPSVTRTGVRKGKIAYMSPEQAAGETLDAATDIFSLGLVLYEMATGRRFYGNDFNEIIKRLGARTDPTAEELAPVPEALREIVARALRADPKRRFRTAADLEAALINATRKSRILPRDLLQGLMVGNFEAEYQAEISGAKLEPSAPSDTPVGPPRVDDIAPPKTDPALQIPPVGEIPAPEDDGTRTRVSEKKDEPAPPVALVAADKQTTPEDDGTKTRVSAEPPVAAIDPTRTVVEPYRPKAAVAPAAAPLAKPEPPLPPKPQAPAPPPEKPVAKFAAKIEPPAESSGGNTGFFLDRKVDVASTSVAPLDLKAAAAAPATDIRQPKPSLLRSPLAMALGVIALVGAGIGIGRFSRPAAPTPTPTVAPTPAPPKLIGAMQIDSTPKDAEVFLDGKKIDTTPLILNRQPVPHTFLVEVKKDGYEPWSRELDLTNENRVDVMAKLAKHAQAGLLTVVIPEGTIAVVDGHPFGKGAGPAEESAAVQPGEHQLRFKKKDALVSETTVVVKPGGVTHFP